MAISEPDVARYGAGEPPGGADAVIRRRVPWRRWLVAAIGVSLLAAVAVLWSLAATYQPVQFGGRSGYGAFPGMPPGAGQLVNTVGGLQGDIYVAPRRGAFTITESITNAGPKQVTIEAVCAVDYCRTWPPGYALTPYPVTGAGPVKWELQSQLNPPLPGSVAACSYKTPCQLSHLSLVPQETVNVAIPVQFAYACFEKGGWSGTDYFYVEERFGPFVHWVRVPYGIPYVYQAPDPPGTPGTSCPAK
jgi:hypothetical protein